MNVTDSLNTEFYSDTDKEMYVFNVDRSSRGFMICLISLISIATDTDPVFWIGASKIRNQGEQSVISYSIYMRGGRIL